MYHLLANYGRLIRNRRYFPLWLGQLISNLSDTLHYIALVVWVYQRTGSSLVVAGTRWSLKRVLAWVKRLSPDE